LLPPFDILRFDIAYKKNQMSTDRESGRAFVLIHLRHPSLSMLKSHVEVDLGNGTSLELCPDFQ
jgi:hypothetical protein